MSSNTDYDDAALVRTCTRKKSYPTEEIARVAISSIRRTSPDAQIRVYGCRHCGGWHVGRSPDSSDAVTSADDLPGRASLHPLGRRGRRENVRPERDDDDEGDARRRGRRRDRQADA